MKFPFRAPSLIDRSRPYFSGIKRFGISKMGTYYREGLSGFMLSGIKAQFAEQPYNCCEQLSSCAERSYLLDSQQLCEVCIELQRSSWHGARLDEAGLFNGTQKFETTV
eukprot:scaffold34999_cov18-Tisochrysis_lutea.AAC.2